MPDFYIETGGLSELGRDLRRAADGFGRATDETVWGIGMEIEATAKGIASEHSRTISGTIKFHPAPGMAIVSAGDDATPIAALYELGNRRGAVSAQTFRHPVFGNTDVWVEQPRFPFLRPALAVDRRSVTKRMEKSWDRALSPYRLKPEG